MDTYTHIGHVRYRDGHVGGAADTYDFYRTHILYTDIDSLGLAWLWLGVVYELLG